MQEANTKQQVVEKLKTSTNILVTVGANPSVDELSAALGLSLMLNRMDKHATAVFSGETPPAINFLEPEKTFENSVDSLRDFIIALDKEKADRLRYKVEDDVVRIFITPYKTVISDKDLQFSQGDFNVELIVALGVEKREDLDAAITAHGRILHDATVVTVNMNGAQSSLGELDWTDTEASSLCEMLMSMSEALQPGLLDEQIATALLTGIVSATDRFRNEYTTPKVMTMSAQLMAAGANQQLIAEKLEEGSGLAGVNDEASDGTKHIAEGEASEKLQKTDEKKPDDGSLEISHEPERVEPEPLDDPSEEAADAAEAELAEQLDAQVEQTAPPATASLEQDLEQAYQEEQNTPAAADEADPQLLPQQEPQGPQIIQPHRTWQTDESAVTPSFGGTLNATTADAEEDGRKEDAVGYNQQILTHDAPPASMDIANPAPTQEPADQPVPSLPQLPSAPEVVTDDAPLEQSHEDTMLNYEPAPVGGVPSPTLSEVDDQTRGRATEDARAAVDAVLADMPFDPANQPLESAGASEAVEVSHAPMQDVAPQQSPFPAPEQMMTQPAGLPVPPPLPPLPDFSTLPPLPGDDTQPMNPAPPDPNAAVQPQMPVANDPGQFRIPGQ